MSQREYMVVNQERAIGILRSVSDWNPVVDLVGLGKQGWELVSVTAMASDARSRDFVALTTEVMWVFKRPLPEKNDGSRDYARLLRCVF